MKAITLFLFLVVFVAGCKTYTGELVDAPAGLQESVQTYCEQRKQLLQDYSVRQFDKDLYLVTVSFQRTLKYEKPEFDSVDLIAQKGVTNWQLSAADKEKLKLLGIKR